MLPFPASSLSQRDICSCGFRVAALPRLLFERLGRRQQLPENGLMILPPVVVRDHTSVAFPLPGKAPGGRWMARGLPRRSERKRKATKRPGEGCGFLLVLSQASKSLFAKSSGSDSVEPREPVATFQLLPEGCKLRALLVQFLGQDGKPFGLPAGQAFQIAQARRTVASLPVTALAQLGPERFQIKALRRPCPLSCLARGRLCRGQFLIASRQIVVDAMLVWP